MLVYDEKAETVTLLKKTIDGKLNNVDGGSELLFEAPRDFQPLMAVISHFQTCMETRETPLSCGRSGVEVIRILEAAR